jgi:hypothetical protein
MSSEREKRAERMIHKLRKLKGFCPMTPEEADAAYDAAPSDEITDDEIRSLVEFATSDGKASWEPMLDVDWDEEVSLGGVEQEALQLYRNKGEDDSDTSEEDSLREELLNDDEAEDKDGVDGGEEPPTDGR